MESTDLGTHTKTTIPPGPPRHREEREEQMQDTAAASNSNELPRLLGEREEEGAAGEGWGGGVGRRERR